MVSYMAKKILQGLMTMALLTLSIPLALAEDEISSLLEQGKEIAFDRKKGNCLACHVMPVPSRNHSGFYS